ncbi:MAG: 1-acyl-sn-glycerol-3-phosphate acyltransferase, partial [Clostridia bacterium]|nr:1-acyl-sn-glycerol-3-phosphate acyltransferase [Clostridia bacterium]
MKLTLNEKIKRRKPRKQGPLVGFVFHTLASILYRNPCKVEFDRQVDLKKYKNTPIIVVSNHSSRMDYAFAVMALKGRRMNFVAAENEFHRSHLQFVFKLGQVIPKKNFVP